MVSLTISTMLVAIVFCNLVKFVLIFCLEWAATIIQTQARSLIAKNKYCERKKAIFILQGALRAWSAIISNKNHSCLSIAASTPWQAQGAFPYKIPMISGLICPITLLASISFQETIDILFS